MAVVRRSWLGGICDYCDTDPEMLMMLPSEIHGTVRTASATQLPDQ